ncbi:3-hydroxyacyl-ACP dehydratase [Geotalea uraniireducens]|uniref:3-hydroxyacyl-ACP dehydratase n=1 Tax=Geotalea uraniireducens TaxID=351604 RepID=A0ABM8EMU2_9BACT|nr:double-cubane-cluster-containing anaerobic reductase [Geotalea uraniireducens]BDV43629.1 3-hydroxyacyl-ACP dehydratase [Geotalea uraniireducens]
MSSNDYTPLWQELGLDLDNHAGLLGVLSDAYRGIYLAQANRPRGMAYFDFVISEVHGLRIKEIYEAKRAGRKVVGGFCVYVPEEVVLAADGICIGLCAGAEVGTAEAERFIPRNSCALIKAFMGFKLAGLCPYVELTDLIVGETTCDGKKKAYEIFDELTGKVHVMELPHMKGPAGKRLWLGEVARFRETMEKLTGAPLTLEGLRHGVAVVNAKRRALQRLSRLREADPAPLSGLDALLVNQVSFYDDPVRFTAKTNELCDELEERVAAGVGVTAKGAPRLLVSGSPMAIPNWKVHAIVEGSGGVVVGEESCIGERNFRDLADEDFVTVEEGLMKIAERSLTIDCACFTPNDERPGNIAALCERLRADGIIHYALQFCTPYLVEAYKVETSLAGVPFLRIETDYSMEDFGQLKTRLEAFIEMLR